MIEIPETYANRLVLKALRAFGFEHYGLGHPSDEFLIALASYIVKTMRAEPVAAETREDSALHVVMGK